MLSNVSNKNKGTVTNVKQNESGKYATSVKINNSVKYYLLNTKLKEKNIVYIQ